MTYENGYYIPSALPFDNRLLCLCVRPKHAGYMQWGRATRVLSVYIGASNDKGSRDVCVAAPNMNSVLAQKILYGCVMQCSKSSSVMLMDCIRILLENCLD